MSEEEKTLEEQTETIIDAIEPETEDDVREAFEINKEDGPLPALGAPLIKAAGDPEPADPNMIQTHLDNFLAKIAGETPIDENVRTSQEFWLNEIAKWTAGQSTDDASTKKIYWHTIKFQRSGVGKWYADGYVIVLSNDATPIDATAFANLLQSPGFYAVVFNGRLGNTEGATVSDTTNDLIGLKYNTMTNSVDIIYRNDTTHVISTNDISITGITVTDLGVNAIN